MTESNWWETTTQRKIWNLQPQRVDYVFQMANITIFPLFRAVGTISLIKESPSLSHVRCWI